MNTQQNGKVTFPLVSDWKQTTTNSPWVLVLSGDYGTSLGEALVWVLYMAGVLTHIAAIVLINFDQDARNRFLKTFATFKVAIPVFWPKTDLFPAGWYNDPERARRHRARWWPAVKQALDECAWSLKARGIRIVKVDHLLSVGGHWPIAEDAARYALALWNPDEVEHVAFLIIPTEPTNLDTFEWAVESFQKVGFSQIVLTNNSQAERNDTLIKALLTGLSLGRRFDPRQPTAPNTFAGAAKFAKTQLTTLAGAETLLPVSISKHWLKKYASLSLHQIVDDIVSMVIYATDSPNANSLGVPARFDLPNRLIIATPLPSNTLREVADAVKQRLNLMQDTAGGHTWLGRHPGLQLIFAPNVVPIDVRSGRTAVVVGALYPLVEEPPILSQAFERGRNLLAFRRFPPTLPALPSPAGNGEADDQPGDEPNPTV